MKKLNKITSFDNLSGDSGVLVMDNGSSRGHSRNASNATSCYSNDTAFGSGIVQLPRRHYPRVNPKALLILLSILFALLCCLGYAYLPLLVKRILQSIINIKPNGEFYDFWKESSEPTEVGIYFFHIENPWAVENGLEKLKVREVGKYYFKQRFVREIHNFSEDKSLVNFTERRYFYFDEEKTKLSLDDKITVVNVPYAALSSLVSRYVDNLPSLPIFSSFGFSYRSINSFLENHNQTLFINVTVRELLYGYRLNILDTAESYTSVFSRFGFDLMPNKLFPNNSFGILNGRNATPDGPYQMYTGLAGTQDDFAFFKSWDGKKKLDFWKADSCNAINGTDGTIWPASVNKKDRLYFFIPDICRSLYVTFQEESQYKGIPTYIFSAPDEVLAGKRTNPDNECFCMEEDEELAEERCTMDGIFDLSGCQNGIPIIVTLPHFLGADKRITDEIEGLKPDPVRHRPELHIEPTMGTVIHGDSRLQMAIRVPPNENLRGFDKLQKDLYIPIFWGYKKLGMSDEVANELKLRLFVPLKAIQFVLAASVIGCILLAVYSFIKWIIFNNKILTLNKDPESAKYFETYNNQHNCELEHMMPRVESATSDLGDSNSLPATPLSSTIELESLVKSPQTDI